MENIYGIYKIDRFVEGYNLNTEQTCYFPENMTVIGIVQGSDKLEETIQRLSVMEELERNYLGIIKHNLDDLVVPYCFPLKTPMIYKYNRRENSYKPFSDTHYKLYLPSESVKTSDFENKENIGRLVYNSCDSVNYTLLNRNEMESLSYIIDLFVSMKEQSEIRESVWRNYYYDKYLEYPKKPILEVLKTIGTLKYKINTVLKMNVDIIDEFRNAVETIILSEDKKGVWTIKDSPIYQEISKFQIQK